MSKQGEDGVVHKRLGDIMGWSDYFTAYYDKDKDIIHNAKEGTLIWWHEKGHQRQWKTGQVQKVSNISEQLILLTLALLVFGSNYAYVPFCFWFGCYLWFEGDAWGYAIKRRYFDAESQA